MVRRALQDGSHDHDGGSEEDGATTTKRITDKDTRDGACETMSTIVQMMLEMEQTYRRNSPDYNSRL
jgi:hypothetical protein